MATRTRLIVSALAAIAVVALGNTLGNAQTVSALPDATDSYQAEINQSDKIVLDFRTGSKCDQCAAVEQILASHAARHPDLKIVKAGTRDPALDATVTTPYLFVHIPDSESVFSVRLENLSDSNADRFLDGIATLVAKGGPLLVAKEILQQTQDKAREQVHDEFFDKYRAAASDHLSTEELIKKNRQLDAERSNAYRVINETFREEMDLINASSSQSQKIAAAWLSAQNGDLFAYALLAKQSLFDELDTFLPPPPLEPY
jgi:hypothetical protein